MGNVPIWFKRVVEFSSVLRKVNEEDLPSALLWIGMMDKKWLIPDLVWPFCCLPGLPGNSGLSYFSYTAFTFFLSDVDFPLILIFLASFLQNEQNFFILFIFGVGFCFSWRSLLALVYFLLMLLFPSILLFQVHFAVCSFNNLCNRNVRDTWAAATHKNSSVAAFFWCKQQWS